jgi:hypothetical protein
VPRIPHLRPPPSRRVRLASGTRRALFGLLSLVGASLASGRAAAQTGDLLVIEAGEDGSARIGLGEVLESGGVQQSLVSGLPVRLQIVTELWRDRLLDAEEGREEWRATVLYDPLSETYRVETAETTVGAAGSPRAATELLRSTITSSLRPSEPGTYYYLSRLQVETFSLTDLEELRRWLQGDLGPAVDADNPVGGAFGRGVRRLFVRALGLPTLRSQARTDEFDWDG